MSSWGATVGRFHCTLYYTVRDNKQIQTNLLSRIYYYRGKLILCSTNFISFIPIFRTSRFLVLPGPGPVNFCSVGSNVDESQTKVSSSTSAFFVIFGKYGRVLSTIDEFRTRLDWLQVSVMKTSCCGSR
jgi:hypothetical protein